MTLKKEQVKLFLEKHFLQKVEILKFSKLGTGFMATGYSVDFKIKGETRRVVIRAISPVGFSNDYPADRMASFWIQHHSAKLLPKHINSLEIMGFNQKTAEIGKVGNFDEFFQILEWAEGEEYLADFERILTTEQATNKDIKRVIILSDYLVQIHKKKFKGKEDVASSLYKRHTRDYVGSRFMVDVLDTYPSEISFASWNKLHKLVDSVYRYREKSKNKFERLSKVHGDFHPGNIRFQENGKFLVLDASRVIWGEPADDVACLGINYLWYALRQTGKFKGVFRDLFNIFWQNYLDKSKDKEIKKVLPLFMAIRSVVLKHPLYFSTGDKVRKKLMIFSRQALAKEDVEAALDN